MNFKYLLMGLVLAGLFFISCTSPPAEEPALDLDQVKAEIQAMEDAYAAAETAKDAEALVAYYSDDAISLPHEETMVSGKDAILARMKAQMEADTSEGGSVRFEVIDVYASGDLAVEVGAWIATSPSGEEERGKFLSVFEKRDGKYVCIRDIWNEDEDDDEDEEMEGEE